MKFLNKIITELLSQNEDLSAFNIILPGKRPVVFIKRILEQENYSGFLPNFFTIEELIQQIAEKQQLQGISLWLFAYSIYEPLPLIPKDDFASFLKWFPTLLKDWDDMMKFANDDQEVLEYMFKEERIKDWAQDLGDEEDTPRKKYLNFWRNMSEFLPILKQKLQEKNWATAGMIHQTARKNLEKFVENTYGNYVFCGFNALTLVEKKLMRSLLQVDKAQCFFQADEYYINDKRQKAGEFLRETILWKEFNEYRNFHWIENDFVKPKNIQLYEVAGNISQTKILPEILKTNDSEQDLSDTVVVLLDENLLPASLDALNLVENINITMGFPLGNLGFSNAIKHLFRLQKQLEKSSSSYYYKDVLAVLEELPNDEADAEIVSNFKAYLEEYNIVYISNKYLKEQLSSLSYYYLLLKPENVLSFLNDLQNFCYQLKFRELDDILYENISHFENAFRVIKNQISLYTVNVSIEILEVLLSQSIGSETIDFQGEPLQGLQVMGLLETRLLNFKNVIMLSVNEGKLPLGNSQNTFLPFDVRNYHDIPTFLDNDSIYAYHFYRLLQDSENISMMFNALSSGANTGEKSRFITQLEIESPHNLEHTIIENTSDPILENLITIEKSPEVLQKLEEWKGRVSPSHLTSYLYDPIQFYLQKILGTREGAEVEEELSSRNYGNLVHYSLEFLYKPFCGEILTASNLKSALLKVDEAIAHAIEKLKHQSEYYDKSMNYIHKAIAKKVIEDILTFDLQLVADGNSLKLISVESNFEKIPFYLDEEKTNKVQFFGYIDRVDELNGVTRIIDFKTKKVDNLKINITEKNIESYFCNVSNIMPMQLCIYQYALENSPEYKNKKIETGIWSFAGAKNGVVPLEITTGSLDDAMVSIKNLILEMLNPELEFSEKVVFKVDV
ncbi:PD-(D/E)XK nuclease family protein [Frigoriflavimonas asaccharolytica]|uniref:PD-(D/E)XK endonuclease-like domain-containing protein n=1 Tax=Frigoriflavimonas asaccharolytica TaxID=2735899 RepID=A0A8J8G848_9FLAO|nr:PD-(D/E)XK nuclease family protein [Frigoriflavimonas asaccharolytica]NRS93026.1 hypothetical protein [Frigoriflavimonas asaccharolytica]